MSKNTVIPDKLLKHIWKTKCNKYCCMELDVRISPDWYENNGTPQCDCGIEMIYSHTEIEIDLLRILNMVDIIATGEVPYQKLGGWNWKKLLEYVKDALEKLI
jgi:hypothetical protein